MIRRSSIYSLPHRGALNTYPYEGKARHPANRARSYCVTNSYDPGQYCDNAFGFVAIIEDITAADSDARFSLAPQSYQLTAPILLLSKTMAEQPTLVTPREAWKTSNSRDTQQPILPRHRISLITTRHWRLVPLPSSNALCQGATECSAPRRRSHSSTTTWKRQSIGFSSTLMVQFSASSVVVVPSSIICPLINTFVMVVALWEPRLPPLLILTHSTTVLSVLSPSRLVPSLSITLFFRRSD